MKSMVIFFRLVLEDQEVVKNLQVFGWLACLSGDKKSERTEVRQPVGSQIKLLGYSIEFFLIFP